MGRPHGVRGQVVVHVESDHPDRFQPGCQLSTADGDSLQVASVVTTQARSPNESILLVQFEGVEDRSDAERLRGTALFVQDRRPLDEGEYWPDELIGLEVRHPDGQVVGHVRQVIEAPQTRLRIELPDGAAVEVPFVAALVPEVEVARGFIVVEPLPGLFDG